MPSLYDPSAMLSTHYSLGNLIATNQQLSQPNMPTQSYMFDNLTLMADVIEQIESTIGPIHLLSGFRTKELQDKLAAQGEPTSAGMSFHEAGRAIDFNPTTMSLTEYFGRMLANENLKNKFAEIAIKPSQNSIHAAINIPGDERDTKVLGLNDQGIYGKLGLDQLANYIAPYMESAEQAYDYAAAQLVTFNKTPLIIAAASGLGLAAYLLLGSKKRRSA